MRLSDIFNWRFTNWTVKHCDWSDYVTWCHATPRKCNQTCTDWNLVPRMFWYSNRSYVYRL